MANRIPLGVLAACAALATAIAAPAGAGARDPLYQWTDAAGAVRYTSVLERIPAEQRSAALIVTAARGAARAAEKPAPQRSDAPPQPAPAPAAPPADANPPTPPPAEAAPPVAGPPPASEKLTALDARIAELERSIAADEAALGDYISDPERAGRRSDSGDVAAIADRLPQLQNELRELRAQRDAAAGTATPNAP